MRLWVKVCLFLSAYSPLFLIIAVRYYSDWFALALFGLVVIASVISWGAILYIAKRRTKEHFKAVSSENRAKDALNYIIPYVISFIGFDFSIFVDIVAFGILMLVIFIIYVESSLIYVNPLLSLFGKRMFSIQAYCPSTGHSDAPEELIVLTSKKYFRKGEQFRAKRITDNFMVVD